MNLSFSFDFKSMTNFPDIQFYMESMQGEEKGIKKNFFVVHKLIIIS